MYLTGIPYTHANLPMGALPQRPRIAVDRKILANSIEILRLEQHWNRMPFSGKQANGSWNFAEQLLASFGGSQNDGKREMLNLFLDHIVRPTSYLELKLLLMLRYLVVLSSVGAMPYNDSQLYTEV